MGKLLKNHDTFSLDKRLKNNIKKNVNLPKYETTKLVSLLDVKQNVGWQISSLNIPEIWTKTKGENVTIGVIDSGCDLKHPDLSDNLLPGINFVSIGKPPIDDCNHGTHSIGIIAAQHNSIGMIGIGPKVKIQPIKVLDKNGNGTTENVCKGIRWAINNKVDIISMSFGSTSRMRNVEKAIDEAAANNIPVFVACGNAGDVGKLFWPAAYPKTISIGSINDKMERSSFSNTGRNLDFMAPGEEIFSTIPKSWYSIMSGTSMACPWAAGVAALLLSYVRNNKTDIKLNTPEDYVNTFIKYATPIKYNSQNNHWQGFGIINPEKMIKGLESQSTTIKDITQQIEASIAGFKG